jgi:hypothetical protein
MEKKAEPTVEAFDVARLTKEERISNAAKEFDEVAKKWQVVIKARNIACQIPDAVLPVPYVDAA